MNRPCAGNPELAAWPDKFITPAPANVQSTGAAPSFEELSAKLDEFNTRLEKEPEGQAAWQEVEAYWSQLAGKDLDGWQGWVVRKGNMIELPADPAMETDAPVQDPTAVLITMQDPFAQLSAKGTFTPSLSASMRVERPSIYVTNLAPQVAESLCIGQKVSISGTITRAMPMYYTTSAIMISSASLTPVGSEPEHPVTADDLRGAVISLRRTVCFGVCPAYEVTVHGDGTVVFEGQRYTRVSGFAIGKTDEATLRSLVKELEDADYFSLKDYTKMEVTDHPSAVTLASFGGKTNVVNHYYGDRSAPETLTQLESKIDELLKTDQWVK
jgi:hypothetical protein